MKTKTLLASMAVASLAIAQPLSAATRSADSVPQRGVQSSQAADRIGSTTDEAEELRGNRFLPIVAVALIVALLILLSSGNKSPG